MARFEKLKKRIKEMVFPPGTNPVSLMFLFTISFSVCSFSMVMTMPFAFLPSMIKSFGYSEKDVGYYAGIVAATFYGGQALASFFWGWLCDRIGSKNSHMIATVLSMIMATVFGMSENFDWAIGSRFSQGIVGALLVTLKAILFKVCDKTNNGIAMGAYVSAYTIGMVIGPALGGYLVFPCKKFQSLCSKRSLFGIYPFLLPNLVLSVCLFLSLILSYFYIPSAKSRLSTEKTTLLEGHSKYTSEDQVTENARYLKLVSFDTTIMEMSFTVISTKSPHSPDDAKEGDKQTGTVSYFHLEHSNKLPTKYSLMSCWGFIKRSSFFQLLKLKTIVIGSSLFAIISFVTIGLEEVYPIYADSPHRYGGLQFTASEIGQSLLFAAIPLIFLTFTLPKLDQKIGSAMMIILTFSLVIFFMPLFPFVSRFSKSNIWIVVVSSYCLLEFFMSGNLFSVNLLLNNATPPQLIGAVNGLNMTVACFFRMLSPATLGPLYTWSLGNEGKLGFPFNHSFSFVLMGFVCLLAVFLTIFLPKEHFHRPNISFNVDELQSSHSLNGLRDKPHKAMEDNHQGTPTNV